jgi:Uma2 family endonuclease
MRIPSLREYVLVSQEVQRVEHFLREDEHHWKLTVFGTPGQEVVLPSIGVSLPLDQIYMNLDRLGAAQEAPPPFLPRPKTLR